MNAVHMITHHIIQQHNNNRNDHSQQHQSHYKNNNQHHHNNNYRKNSQQNYPQNYPQTNQQNDQQKSQQNDSHNYQQNDSHNNQQTNQQNHPQNYRQNYQQTNQQTNQRIDHIPVVTLHPQINNKNQQYLDNKPKDESTKLITDEERIEKLKKLAEKYHLARGSIVKLRKLESYDIVVIVDDSTSMLGPSKKIKYQNEKVESRWEILRKITTQIVEI